MREDNHLDHIDDENLNGSEGFRGGENWSVELVSPKPIVRVELWYCRSSTNFFGLASVYFSNG